MLDLVSPVELAYYHRLSLIYNMMLFMSLTAALDCLWLLLLS